MSCRSVDDETQKLIRLRRVTQEAQARRETLFSYRKLNEEKQRLEVDLGISMDRVSGRK